LNWVEDSQRPESDGANEAHKSTEEWQQYSNTSDDCDISGTVDTASDPFWGGFNARDAGEKDILDGCKYWLRVDLRRQKNREMRRGLIVALVSLSCHLLV
jgi:hypothetical protein